MDETTAEEIPNFRRVCEQKVMHTQKYLRDERQGKEGEDKKTSLISQVIS